MCDDENTLSQTLPLMRKCSSRNNAKSYPSNHTVSTSLKSCRSRCSPSCRGRHGVVVVAPPAAPLHCLHDLRWGFGMGNRNRSGTRPLNRVGRDRGPTEAAGRGRRPRISVHPGGPTSLAWSPPQLSGAVPLSPPRPTVNFKSWGRQLRAICN
jgi:hypothetical protein